MITSGFLVACVVIVMGGSAPLSAQTVTGTIMGTVTDNTGGVMPGVTITMRNTGTGFTRSEITDAHGRYQLRQLPTGSYEVTAELQGFKRQLRRLQLTVGAEEAIDFHLEMGALEETVLVTAEAPLVQTSASSVGALVDQKQIQQLPLNARDIQQLAMIQPGVQSQSAYNGLYGANISVRGSRPEQNRYLLNGIDASTTFGTSPVSAANIMMGVEGLQEFRVLTSDYSAAYGLKQGGVVNMITKGGTNEVHGSAYEFARNDRFDTRNYFDKGGVPPFQRDQFGGSLGGPIRKGKTFFFANFEQFRQRLGLSLLGTVPDQRAREGYLPAAGGGETYVGIADKMKPYLALFPMPNGRNLGGGVAEYFSNPQQRIDERYVTTRIDHQLSRVDNLWGVFTGDWSKSLTPEESNSFGAYSERGKRIFSLQDSHTFNDHFIASFRFGFNWNRYLDENDPLVDIDRSLYLASDPFLTPTHRGQFPNISVSGLSGLAATGNGPVWYTHKAISIDAEFNYHKGTHSWQFGGSWLRSADDGSYVAEQAKGETSFDTLAQFMQGQASRVNIILPTSTPFSNFRYQLGSAYAEDSMHLASNFTLNAGLRWEALLQMDEAKGNVSNLRGGPTDPTPTLGNPILIGQKTNFAPRLGFNWDVFGNGKTSIQGGGGIFYNQITPFSLREMTNNYPITTQVSLNNPQFPNIWDGYSASTAPPDIASIQFRPKTPTLYSYHVGVQRNIGHKTSASVSYVGSQGRHLPSGTIVNNDFGNRLVPEIVNGEYYWAPNLKRPNPNFGRIGFGQFIYESSYNALQVNVERRIGQGLGFTGNYTLAHCIDDVSGELNSAVQNTGAGSVLQYARDSRSGRGNCSFTSVHSGNITTTWDLPGRNLKGAAGAVLGGWRWSTITTVQGGLPFNVTTGFNRSRQNVASSALGDRPDWAPGCGPDNAILGGIDAYFDVKCFVMNRAGYLGNVPARILRGPGLFTSDWSIAKNFSLPNGKRIEFQVQAFNITNRANFAVPAGAIWSNATRVRPTVARITRTVTPSRQMQFGFKFAF